MTTIADKYKTFQEFWTAYRLTYFEQHKDLVIRSIMANIAHINYHYWKDSHYEPYEGVFYGKFFGKMTVDAMNYSRNRELYQNIFSQLKLKDKELFKSGSRTEHSKTKEQLVAEKETVQKLQGDLSKEKLAAEEAVRLANEAKETAIREKNEAEAAREANQKKITELEKQLTEKEVENKELITKLEEKAQQIKELQTNNNLLMENAKKLKECLENYQEHLRSQIQEAEEALTADFFTEIQQQEISQEKQEYEAKIMQVEQFIKEV